MIKYDIKKTNTIRINKGLERIRIKARRHRCVSIFKDQTMCVFTLRFEERWKGKGKRNKKIEPLLNKAKYFQSITIRSEDFNSSFS